MTDDATWKHLISVQPGQPFRLGLWQSLSMVCADPDSVYFDLLREGVPLGISSPIPACKVMAPPAPPDSATIPLQHCESSWKSAIDHSDIVDDSMICCRKNWLKAGLPLFPVVMMSFAGSILFPQSENSVSFSPRAARLAWLWIHPCLV